MVDHSALLASGIENWNRWRSRHPDAACDLSAQDLSTCYGFEGDFRGVNFKGSNLQRACFIGANLAGANLSKADLRGAYLSSANLLGANLSGARLAGTHLDKADLRQTNLQGADITAAHTDRALLTAALSQDQTRKQATTWLGMAVAAVAVLVGLGLLSEARVLSLAINRVRPHASETHRPSYVPPQSSFSLARSLQSNDQV